MSFVDDFSETPFYYEKNVKRNDIKKLLNCIDKPKEFYPLFSEILNVPLVYELDSTNPLSSNHIYLNFFLEIVKFGINENFSIEQHSTLISIIQHTFKVSMEKKMSSLDSFAILKSILKRHEGECQPFQMGIFNEDKVKKTLNFMLEYFYKNYSLFEITMTKFIDFNLYTFEPCYDDFPKPTELPNEDKWEKIDPNSVFYLHEYIANEENSDDNKDSENNQDEQNSEDFENELAKENNFSKTEDELRLEKEIEERFKIMEPPYILTESLILKAEELNKKKK